MTKPKNPKKPPTFAAEALQQALAFARGECSLINTPRNPERVLRGAYTWQQKQAGGVKLLQANVVEQSITLFGVQAPKTLLTARNAERAVLLARKCGFFRPTAPYQYHGARYEVPSGEHRYVYDMNFSERVWLYHRLLITHGKRAPVAPRDTLGQAADLLSGKVYMRDLWHAIRTTIGQHTGFGFPKAPKRTPQQTDRLIQIHTRSKLTQDQRDLAHARARPEFKQKLISRCMTNAFASLAHLLLGVSEQKMIEQFKRAKASFQMLDELDVFGHYEDVKDNPTKREHGLQMKAIECYIRQDAAQVLKRMAEMPGEEGQRWWQKVGFLLSEYMRGDWLRAYPRRVGLVLQNNMGYDNSRTRYAVGWADACVSPAHYQERWAYRSQKCVRVKKSVGYLDQCGRFVQWTIDNTTKDLRAPVGFRWRVGTDDVIGLHRMAHINADGKLQPEAPKKYLNGDLNFFASAPQGSVIVEMPADLRHEFGDWEMGATIEAAQVEIERKREVIKAKQRAEAASERDEHAARLLARFSTTITVNFEQAHGTGACRMGITAWAAERGIPLTATPNLRQLKLDGDWQATRIAEAIAMNRWLEHQASKQTKHL